MNSHAARARCCSTVSSRRMALARRLRRVARDDPAALVENRVDVLIERRQRARRRYAAPDGLLGLIDDLARDRFPLRNFGRRAHAVQLYPERVCVAIRLEARCAPYIEARGQVAARVVERKLLGRLR